MKVNIDMVHEQKEKEGVFNTIDEEWIRNQVQARDNQIQEDNFVDMSHKVWIEPDNDSLLSS